MRISEQNTTNNNLLFLRTFLENFELKRQKLKKLDKGKFDSSINPLTQIIEQRGALCVFGFKDI